MQLQLKKLEISSITAPKIKGVFVCEFSKLLFEKSIDIIRTLVYNHAIKTVVRLFKVTNMSTNKANRKHRYKIVKPFRFFVFVLICSMLTILAAYAISGSGKADAAALTRYATVTVQENDTLWDIVETYNSGSNIDTRSALYDLYDINDKDEADIKPGDVILVPIYK